MARDTDLYYNLVTDEDSLTELLANCLQFPTFRDVFAGLVVDKMGLPGFAFQYRSVETQKCLSDLSRPDLVIEDESVCLFIECKVTGYRALTPNQPESYLKYLGAQKGKETALMFLVPYYYEHETLIRQKAAKTQSPVRFEVVYWNDLIARLQQANIAQGNVALEHFLALLRAWFEIKAIRFSKDEIMLLQNKEFPAQLLKLFELITEVKNKFPKTYKMEEISNDYGFGYYVKSQKAHLLWFGCSFEFWKDHGTFFHLGVGADEFKDFSPAVVKRFKERFGQEAIWYEPWKWYLYSVPENLIEDRQNVKKLAQFIEDVARFCG